MKKMCLVAAVPQSIQLFMSDVARNAAKSFDVTVASHPSGTHLTEILGLPYYPVIIERKPAPLSDLKSLIALIVFFRKNRFDLVHSITPKTGLLSMLAAFLTGTPLRVHTFTGQVWLNKRGLKRSFFKWMDKLIVLLSTNILVDSPSQRDFLQKEGVLKNGQGVVLNKGSICGVDTSLFKRDIAARERLRNQASLPKDAIVVTFMARLTEQKGILELAEAFERLATYYPNLYLWVIGPEESVSYSQVLKKASSHSNRIHRSEFTTEPAAYLSASDILCLPSHMEGFGQVIVNASACELPVVATRIIGVRDAVEENVTGLLYSAGNINELTQSLSQLIDNCQLRTKFGLAGRTRVINHFEQSLITDLTINFYHQVITNYEASH